MLPSNPKNTGPSLPLSKKIASHSKLNYNLPIYIRNPATGAYERAAKTHLKSFRADWLFSSQPTPGTLLFAGYGNTLANLDEDPRTARLRRTADGFFLKVSYLFRL